MNDQGHNHSFEVIRGRIGIFAQRYASTQFDMGGGERIVIVSLGAGETQITVLNDEAEAEVQWTAVFGWSSLCDVLEPQDAGVVLKGPEQISRALKGTLRLYGRSVNTDEALGLAQAHLRGALSYILDETIGRGEEFDRILIAAPCWCHDALEGCMDLRPHVAPEIQDL